MKLFDGWKAGAWHGPLYHVVKVMVPLCPARVSPAGQTVYASFINLDAAWTLMCLEKGGARTQATGLALLRY
jgi:hypothetical protein